MTRHFAIKAFSQLDDGNIAGITFNTAQKIFKLRTTSWSSKQKPDVCRSGWHVCKWNMYSIIEQIRTAKVNVSNLVFFLVECRGKRAVSNKTFSNNKVAWQQIRLIQRLDDVGLESLNIDNDRYLMEKIATSLLKRGHRERRKQYAKDPKENRLKKIRKWMKENKIGENYQRLPGENI